MPTPSWLRRIVSSFLVLSLATLPGWGAEAAPDAEDASTFLDRAEAAGRREREQRCLESNAASQTLGTYRFEYHKEPSYVATYEVEVSDVAFAVTRRFESSS